MVVRYMDGRLHGYFTGRDAVQVAGQTVLVEGDLRVLGIGQLLGLVKFNIQSDDIGIAKDRCDGQINADIAVLDVGRSDCCIGACSCAVV